MQQRIEQIAKKFEEQIKAAGYDGKNIKGFEVTIPAEDFYFVLTCLINPQYKMFLDLCNEIRDEMVWGKK